jgi:serine O-acetyltransferase
VFETFKQDVRRWVIPQQVAPAEQVTLRRTLGLLLRHKPLRAMLWFRFGSWCSEHRIRLLPSLMAWILSTLYGMEIAVGPSYGGGLYIPHTVGMVLSPSQVGANCSIIANVTIGMRNEHAFPVIGDHVFIGAGARVLGGITIGDGAVIGANAVVIEDVPPGATVVGIPARIVRQSPSTDVE